MSSALAFLCNVTTAFENGFLTEEEFKTKRALAMADMQ
jgi:hypothetical protein